MPGSERALARLSQALDLSECALTDYQPSAVEAGTRAIAVMEGLTHFRIDMSVSGCGACAAMTARPVS